MVRSLRFRIVGVVCVLMAVVIASAFALSGDERTCAPGGGSLSAYEWRTSAWDSSEAASGLIGSAEDLCLSVVYLDVTGLAVEDQ